MAFKGLVLWHVSAAKQIIVINHVMKETKDKLNIFLKLCTSQNTNFHISWHIWKITLWSFYKISYLIIKFPKKFNHKLK